MPRIVNLVDPSKLKPNKFPSIVISLIQSDVKSKPDGMEIRQIEEVFSIKKDIKIIITIDLDKSKTEIDSRKAIIKDLPQYLSDISNAVVQQKIDPSGVYNLVVIGHHYDSHSLIEEVLKSFFVVLPNIVINKGYAVSCSSAQRPLNQDCNQIEYSVDQEGGSTSTVVGPRIEDANGTILYKFYKCLYEHHSQKDFVVVGYNSLIFPGYYLLGNFHPDVNQKKDGEYVVKDGEFLDISILTKKYPPTEKKSQMVFGFDGKLYRVHPDDFQEVGWKNKREVGGYIENPDQYLKVVSFVSKVKFSNRANDMPSDK